MFDLSIEQLVVFAVVAAFMLFRYVLQKLAERVRRTREPAAYAPGTVTDSGPATAGALPAKRPTLRRPHPALARLERPQDLRATVVLMTVLGPCRAIDDAAGGAPEDLADRRR